MKFFTISVDLLLEARGQTPRTLGISLAGPRPGTCVGEAFLEGSTSSVREPTLGSQGRAGFPSDQSRFLSL